MPGITGVWTLHYWYSVTINHESVSSFLMMTSCGNIFRVTGHLCGEFTVFQGHLPNFKVTRDKKLLIVTQIGRFQTVTPDQINWWPWNDAQSLKQHRRSALLFFKIIRKNFKVTPGQKIANFDLNWAFPDCKITRPVAPVKYLTFALFKLVFLHCNMIFDAVVLVKKDMYSVHILQQYLSPFSLDIK